MSLLFIHRFCSNTVQLARIDTTLTYSRKFIGRLFGKTQLPSSSPSAATLLSVFGPRNKTISRPSCCYLQPSSPLLDRV